MLLTLDGLEVGLRSVNCSGMIQLPSFSSMREPARRLTVKRLAINRLLIGLIFYLCNWNFCFAQTTGSLFPQVVVGQVGDGIYYRSTFSILERQKVAPRGHS